MSKKFKVKVIEKLERIIEVDAEDMMAAIDIVQNEYDKGNIFLGKNHDFEPGSEEIMGVDEE